MILQRSCGAASRVDSSKPISDLFDMQDEIVSRLAKLHVHPKPVPTALHGGFEHVTDVQLAPDLLLKVKGPAQLRA